LVVTEKTPEGSVMNYMVGSTRVTDTKELANTTESELGRR
jgi:hypothetical protein